MSPFDGTRPSRHTDEIYHKPCTTTLEASAVLVSGLVGLVDAVVQDRLFPMKGDIGKPLEQRRHESCQKIIEASRVLLPVAANFLRSKK